VLGAAERGSRASEEPAGGATFELKLVADETINESGPCSKAYFSTLLIA
jgi:hypothetical protein